MPVVFPYERSYELLLKPWLGGDFFAELEGCRFQPDGDSFDPQSAWWAQELCRLAYKWTKEERAPELARVGLRERGSVGDRVFFAMLVEGEGGVWGERVSFLIFRGTATMAAWRLNARFLPKRLGESGRVHRGFLVGLEEHWIALRDLVAKASGALHLAGHSLGATHAVLMANRLGERVREVHTFGMPRLGDAQFAETLSTQTVWRVVNGRDCVTRMPWRWPGGYRHLGAEIRLAVDRNTPRRLLSPPSSASDHAPVNYTAALARMALADMDHHL